jgi:ribosomal protein L29
MSTKAFKELKNLTKDELAVKVRETEAKLFEARIKKTTGQLENPSSLWQMRKSLARMKMLQTQPAESQTQLRAEKAKR